MTNVEEGQQRVPGGTLESIFANLTPRQVNAIHSRSDKDSSKTAQHHSLGVGADQASPGNHTHDGINSKSPLVGLFPSFPSVASATYSQSQMQAVIDALRALGAGS